MKFIILLVVAGLNVFAPAQKPAAPLRIQDAVPFQLGTLDPHVVNNADMPRFWSQVYESPLALESASTTGQLSIVPRLLAALPELGDDGRTLTFEFRPGIRFHDDPCFDEGKGRELVAEDFVNVMRRHIDPRTESPFYRVWVAGRFVGVDAVRAEAESIGAMDWERPIAGVTATSRYGVKLVFTEQYGMFPSLMTMPWLSMIPKEAFFRYGAQLREHMVGTGPYFHDEKSSTPEAVVFSRNPEYWNAAASVPSNDGIVVNLLGRLDLQEKRFASGDLTLLDLYTENLENWLTPKGRIRSGMKPSGIQVVKTDLVRLHYVIFNTRNKILAKKPLRQALCLALNRNWYVEEFYKGAVELAEHLVPPSLPLDSPKSSYPWAFGKYDLARAKKLLAEAGHEGGEGLPEFIIDYPNTSALADLEFAFLRDSWAKIGVKVQLKKQNYSDWAKRIGKGQSEIAVGFWFADYPDADDFFLMLYSRNAPDGAQELEGPNAAFFKNEEYDRLYERSGALLPGKERGKLYERMIAIAQDECAFGFLAHPARYTLVQPGIAGFNARSPYAASMAGVRRK